MLIDSLLLKSQATEVGSNTYLYAWGNNSYVQLTELVLFKLVPAVE